MPAVWYQKTVTVSREQLQGRVRLHFGAVDYECFVYINGKEAGFHRGGYSSFVFDITDYLVEGENNLMVYAVDDTRNPLQPIGKQSTQYDSYAIFYTRTTGIWQTVWLEFVPNAYIKNVRYFPNIDEQTLTIEASFVGTGTFGAKAFYEGRECGSASVKVLSGTTAVLTIALSELHLWEIGAGRLYDLELTFGEDRVRSYFGITRPCIDSSGGFHIVTDIYDAHNYIHNVKDFVDLYEDFKNGGPLPNIYLKDEKYIPNLPVFISEYCGVTWDPETDVWGFEDGPQNLEDFITFYRGVTHAMLDNPRMFGYVYTQLYDIWPENNGLYTFERSTR